MLASLIESLIKTMHDLITHASVGNDISDAATTAEDVVGLIPAIAGPDAALISLAVNSAVAIAQAAIAAKAPSQAATPVVAPVVAS